ncbi:MAG: hypothetical protein JO257_09565 [Deltaproteobacteria bacterium]|nr:hypothetical protein [Deltaproteobacteria bacterium]
MHRGLLLLPLGLAGCAQLFGIDNTTGVDAGSSVTLSVQHVSVGATPIKAPQDLTGQTASFLVGDANALMPNTAVIAGPGTWTADIATGTPPALFTLPDLPMGHHDWALPSRAMRGNLVVFEHPNATAPSATSQLALNVTLPAMYNSETLIVYAVGAWMNHVLNATEVPAAMATSITSTIPYSSFAPAQSSVMPARITAADIVLVLEYTGSDLSGVLQAAPFDQTDATDMITGTMVAVTHDKPLSVPVPANIATRFSAVRPAVGAPATSWVISAAPGATVGTSFGPQLLTGAPAAADTMITAMYGNPFESLQWPAIFNLTAVGTRTYTFNTVPVSLNAALAAYVDASATDAPFTAGLPTTVTIDQTQLTTDGQMVAINTAKPIEITFSPDQSTNTVYTAQIDELTADMTAMTVKRTPVFAGVSTEHTFDIPSDLLVSGHTYVLRAGALQGGYTQAASGDLQTWSFPVSYGQLDAGVFTVQ